MRDFRAGRDLDGAIGGGASVAGDGRTSAYRTIEVAAGAEVTHAFESWLNAYWVRFVSDEDGVLSAQLTYE